MKSLINYIKESCVLESEEVKIVKFNFNGIDNSEELLKSLESYDYVTVDDKEVKISISKDNYTKLDSVQDILQQSIEKERNSAKSTNNEEYAQKVVKLEKQLAKMSDIIDMYVDGDNENEE